MRTPFASAVAVAVAAGCGSEITHDPASDVVAASTSASGGGSSGGGPSTATGTGATGGRGGAGGREEWPCSFDAALVYATGAGGGPDAVVGCEDPPGTEVLATDWKLMEFFARIATDATHVYVGYYGESLVRVPKSGGALEVFADEEVLGLSLTATHAYWNDWGNGSPIRAKSLSGGPAITLATVHPETAPWDVAADARDVYFSTVDYDPPDPPYPARSIAGVFRVSALGGVPTKLADALLNPFPIAVDDAWVYYFDYFCPMRVAKSGGTPTLLLDHAALPSAVAIDADAVYFGDGPILRVPKDGSTVTIVTAASTHVGHIAIDGNYLYWSDNQSIARTAKLGGPIEVVVRCAKASNPEQFAIDDGWLYWRGGVGDILKRAPI